MCLAVPGRVTEIKDKTCIAEIFGVSREVSIELLDDVGIGDYIIIHAGCAIQKVDEQEAMKTIELIKEVGELSDDKIY